MFWFFKKKDYVDWSKIPDKYKWVAQDSWDEGSCIIRAYPKKPIIDETFPPDWRGKNWESFNNAIIGPIPPWRESIRKRP